MKVRLFIKLSICLFAISFNACQIHEKYHFSIKDFNKKFQPFLTEIVSKNIVGYNASTSFIRQQMSDNELLSLSLSEHPVLRGVALRELTERKSVDQLQLILNHLDDTAVINYDRGEWGIQFRTVSDDMIDETQFRDSVERAIVVDKVIMENSYLSSAFKAIIRQKLSEKYYPVILKMTKREWPREESEMALLALASYRKKKDIPYIRQMLIDHRGKLSEYALELIQNYPDTSYLTVLEKSLRGVYRNMNWDNSQYLAILYINTVASYKNKRSANLLSIIFHRKPILPSLTDTISFKSEINKAIIENNCPEYSQLISEMTEYLKWKRKDSILDLEYQSDPNFQVPVDTTTYQLKIRW